MTTLVERLKELEERVLQYKTLQLPGQPMMTHMGTSYLIDDLLAALKDAAALSEGEMGWRPIETAPKDETLIIIGSYNGRSQWCSDIWSGKALADEQAKIANGVYKTSPHLMWEPTHWMPLPASPSMKEDGNV